MSEKCAYCLAEYNSIDTNLGVVESSVRSDAETEFRGIAMCERHFVAYVETMPDEKWPHAL